MGIRKKIVITFWVLLAVCVFFVFFPTNYTIQLWATVICISVFPIIGIILVATSPKKKGAQETIKELTEQEKKEQAEKELMAKLMGEEKNRKDIERYKIGKIGSWGIVPGLMSLVFLIYLLWDFFANKNINWYVVGIMILIGFPLISTADFEEKWDKRLVCKEEISNSNKDYPKHYYDYDYVYTDSNYQYYLYKTAKIISYLTSVLAIIAIGIMAFFWLGSITIAPTTIIIILLIIIIYNQERNRE